MTTTQKTCNHIVSNEATDYVCIAPPNHAGDHEYVDAMGLDYVDADGKPVYRPGWNYAR